MTDRESEEAERAVGWLALRGISLTDAEDRAYALGLDSGVNSRDELLIEYVQYLRQRSGEWPN